MPVPDSLPVPESAIEFDPHKFEELVLYLAARFERETYFGSTRLDKLLFCSDFMAYLRLGKPITGADYMALERGPSPRLLLPIRRQLLQRGDIALDRRGSQDRIRPLREPNLSSFSAAEIAIVDAVIEELKSSPAALVGELSHTFLGWKAAFAQSPNTSIPYSTVFVSNRPADAFEAAHAEQLAERYGWKISTFAR